MAGIVLIFIVVYVPDATKQLQIYPEDALKDAIIRYRDDADTQDFIDGVQQEVTLRKQVRAIILQYFTAVEMVIFRGRILIIFLFLLKT